MFDRFYSTLLTSIRRCRKKAESTLKIRRLRNLMTGSMDIGTNNESLQFIEPIFLIVSLFTCTSVQNAPLFSPSFRDHFHGNGLCGPVSGCVVAATFAPNPQCLLLLLPAHCLDESATLPTLSSFQNGKYALCCQPSPFQ